MAMSETNYSQTAGTVETVLWTNSSPSSNFDIGNVTLSDDITNYDFIKITFKAYKSSNSDLQCSIYFDKDYITSYLNGTYTRTASPALKSNNLTTDATYVRPIALVKANTKQIRFLHCIVFYGGTTSQTTGTQDNSCCIPLQIVGIKTN